MSIRRLLTVSLALVPVLWGGARAQETIELREGLVVERLGSGGRVPFFTDPVALAMARGEWSTPAAGDVLRLGDQEAVWEAASADEEGRFRGRAMRGGHALFRVASEADRVMILDARGHSLVYVDGELRAGDPYSNGLIRVPVLLRAGTTEFLFQGARGQLTARLVEPAGSVVFDTADYTLPDVIEGEEGHLWAGVPLLNASTERAAGLRVRATVVDAAFGEVSLETRVPGIVALGVHKAAVRIPRGAADKDGKVTVALEVMQDDRVLHMREITLSSKAADEKHTRTFVSGIDGSVQYFAVTPMRRSADLPKLEHRPAMFLTLHGASVEGRGQANAYAHKDWGHVVAPTNRRPFGFDWEDWGRIDAVEVLDTAGELFNTDPERTYLTGHSMGGHGTWQVGAHFAGRFAAIAPSAGWVSFWSYGGLIDYGTETPVREAFTRAASPSDTLALSENYTDLGVYILHGDADNNVPVSQARTMREHLAGYHPNFAYYEEPGAGHWWGNRCVDWPPMFEFFAHNVRERFAHELTFVTANPAVSATHRWVTVLEQETPLEPSRVELTLDAEANEITGSTENVTRLAFKLHETQRSVTSEGDDGRPISRTIPDTKQPLRVTLDGEEIEVTAWVAVQPFVLSRVGGSWRVAFGDDKARKGPHRAGPFKHVFDRDAVLVYGTGGDEAENAWAMAKARYDAETFKYRGNGSFDVVSDMEFAMQRSSSAGGGPTLTRNVVLYGNSDTNRAWEMVLGDERFGVSREGVRVGGDETLTGDLGVLMVRPARGDDGTIGDSVLVGIVGGTTLAGCRATDRLPYFVSGVAYPDYTVVTPSVYEEGVDGVVGAGFFDGGWE